MADRIMQRGDTHPPLKGLAADEDGPVDLSAADSMEAILKSGITIIELPAFPIIPPEVDDDETYNWTADFETGDTDDVGIYTVRLVVTWDAAATPPEIETFPNTLAGSDTLEIEDEA